MNKLITALAISTMVSTGLFAQEKTEDQSAKNLGVSLAKKVTSEVTGSAINEAIKALPKVLATFGNGQKITSDVVVKEIKSISDLYAQQGQTIPAEEITTIAKQIVDTQATTAILLQTAQVAGFKADPQKIQEEIKEVTSNPMMAQMLQMRNMSQEELTKQITEANIISQWLEKEVISKINVKEEDIKKFYTENIAQYFTKPAGRSISHILVREEEGKDAKAEIEAIAKQLKEGAKFEDLAAAKSACPSGKESKGSIGNVPDDSQNIDKTFLEAAKKLTKGQVSEPVQTQFGYHIIRVDNISEKPTITPYEEAKASIVDFLKRNESQVKIQETIEKLKKANNFKINI